MTIKVHVYNGVQISKEISKITPPTADMSSIGVVMMMSGSTFKDGRWEHAAVDIEMSQDDALDMAMTLFIAAEKHGEYARKAPANFVKRLAKRMARKEKASA